MSQNKNIYVRCLEVVQPIGTFYIAVINANDLVQISYADQRKISENDLDQYLGIQRELTQSRVIELKQYVTTVDATFPTSIILAIDSKNAEYKDGTMIIKRAQEVAKIIDGQHRIAGLQEYNGPTFQLNVVIFIDMDIEDQAMVFATINLAQTKVNKSLAIDLYELTKARSPQKTCHNIATLMNRKKGSPFKDKIKILGKATGKQQETLTQATFVTRLIKYISKNRKTQMEDRDLLKRGKQPARAVGPDKKKLIFRNMFLDKKDEEIARIVWNFFLAVYKRWPSGWGKVKEGNILNRTTGFAALIRFMGPVYNELMDSAPIVKTESFYQILEKINLKEEEFTPENYKPGSGGEAALLKDLLEKSGLS